MKRILSVLIAAAMLLAALTVCVLPAVASDGMFTITTKREDKFIEDEEDRKSQPGGIYTDDGFKVNPAGTDYEVTWPNNTPYYTVQTTEQEYLMGGYYMEIAIDDFSYLPEEGETGFDKWFAFSIWDSHWIQPAQVGTDAQGKDWGNGVEVLLRLSAENGHVNWLEFYDDTEGTARTKCNVAGNPTYKEDDQGRQVVWLELKYNDTDGLYEFYINDMAAPESFNEALTDWLYERGDKAYVGFSVQHAKQNGKAAFTVTKVGETKETATVPNTGDPVDAIQRDNSYAPVDHTPVEDGQPAISIKGSDPDSYKAITSLSGVNDIFVTEDGTFKFVARTGGYADPLIRVPNTVSYDMKEYPVLIVICKNYCSCVYQDLDYDGTPDPICMNAEVLSSMYMAGKYVDGTGDNLPAFQKLTDLNVSDEQGNSYSVFMIDYTSRAAMEEGEQRIHGLKITFNDVKYLEAGRNSFEVYEFSFFASVEAAEAYAYDYLDTLVGYSTTDKPVETDTDPVEDTTPSETESKPQETETEPKSTETESKPQETESKPQETESKKPAETQPKDDGNDGGDDKKSGCGSVAGFGAIAIVAVAGIGLVSFKKKED